MLHGCMSRIDGIKEKIKRAKEHVRDLEERLVLFRNDYPYEVISHIDPRGAERVFSFKQRHEIPIEIPLRTGEILQNLRTALDYLVGALVVKNGGTETSVTGYPIFENSAKYKTGCGPKIRSYQTVQRWDRCALAFAQIEQSGEASSLAHHGDGIIPRRPHGEAQRNDRQGSRRTEGWWSDHDELAHSRCRCYTSQPCLPRGRWRRILLREGASTHEPCRGYRFQLLRLPLGAHSAFPPESLDLWLGKHENR